MESCRAALFSRQAFDTHLVQIRLRLCRCEPRLLLQRPQRLPGRRPPAVRASPNIRHGAQRHDGVAAANPNLLASDGLLQPRGQIAGGLTDGQRFHASSLDRTDKGGKPLRALPESNFWQHNVAIGYRLLKRHAELRVSLLNIFDQDYRLNPLTLYRELPRERTLAVSLKFYF